MLPYNADTEAASQIHMKGIFLEKPGLLKQALTREEEWMTTVPDYNGTLSRTKTPMTSLERSLYKLNAERELGQWAGQFVDPNAALEDDGNDGGNPQSQSIMIQEDKVWEEGMKELEEGGQFDPDGPVFHADTTTEAIKEDAVSSSILLPNPCVTSVPPSNTIPSLGYPSRKDNVLVIIRHGKTEHNKLGLFTGWEDAPLAPEGIIEAREAGRLLKLHGFEFDVVYTSWLSRAIETAWYAMDELDCLWLPIIKSWRLNERMYGELTGLSKNMVKQRHGEKQFKAWRRGYKIRCAAHDKSHLMHAGSVVLPYLYAFFMAILHVGLLLFLLFQRITQEMTKGTKNT